MRKFVIALIVSGLIFAASSAMAATMAPMGFKLVISGDFNVPTLALTNIGSLNIESFTMTIGHPYGNFDFVNSISDPGTGYTLTTPDDVDNGVRSDTIEFTFTTFNPSLTFGFATDLDNDSYDSPVDYRYILFNNGAMPNSVVTVGFTGGKQLQGEWPDADLLDSYTMQVSSVPVPAAVWLLGSGLVGLLGLRRKLS